MNWIKAAAAALALALSSQANAQAKEAGWYIGGSLGQSELKDWCQGVTVSCDAKDSSWRFFGGYQINRHLAVELGYADLGEVNLGSGTVTAGAEATAWDLVGIAAIPFGRFSAYGKLGAYRGEIDASTTVALFGFTRVGEASESNTDVTYGFGLKFDISPNFSVRGEWQRYLDAGGRQVGGETDIDVLSLGALFRF